MQGGSPWTAVYILGHVFFFPSQLYPVQGSIPSRLLNLLLNIYSLVIYGWLRCAGGETQR